MHIFISYLFENIIFFVNKILNLDIFKTTSTKNINQFKLLIHKKFIF